MSLVSLYIALFFDRISHILMRFDVNYAFDDEVFPQFDVSGEVSVKFDDNSAPEIDKWVLNPEGGSAESNIIIQWGNGTADGTLKFDVNAIYTGHSYDFGNEAGVFVSLPFQGVDDGTNEAIEVLIANATDRSW